MVTITIEAPQGWGKTWLAGQMLGWITGWKRQPGAIIDAESDSGDLSPYNGEPAFLIVCVQTAEGAVSGGELLAVFKQLMAAFDVGQRASATSAIGRGRSLLKRLGLQAGASPRDPSNP